MQRDKLRETGSPANFYNMTQLQIHFYFSKKM